MPVRYTFNLAALDVAIAPAANAHKLAVIIPWPADELGEYGIDNKTTPAELDAWVVQALDIPADCDWGAIPGRTRDLRPVVTVTMWRRPAEPMRPVVGRTVYVHATVAS